MQVKVLRFTMHNTASALWSQNGRSSGLGNLLCVGTVRGFVVVFCSQYILFVISCVHTLGYFFRGLEQADLAGR